MYNKITLIGNINKPETVELPSGDTCVTFSLAVNYKIKDEKKTDWFTVKLFGKFAEKMQEHLTKGKRVFVDGPMRSRTVELGDEKRTYWTVYADILRLLGDLQKKPTHRRAMRLFFSGIL